MGATLDLAFVSIFREVEPIREGKEPKAFWEAIGGYEDYATGKRMEVTEIYQQFNLKAFFLCLFFGEVSSLR